MAPGIFQLRTACFPIVIPVRIAFCLPLLFCTLDGYSTQTTLHPAGPIPFFTNMTMPLGETLPSGGSDRGATDGALPAHLVPIYIALSAADPSFFPGRTLSLAFAAFAMAFSIASMVIACVYPTEDEAVQDDGEPAFWKAGRGEVVGNDARSRRRNLVRRRRTGVLFMGTATRLLLAALGTIAFIKVFQEKSAIKHGSFVAIECLGWITVAMLYLGAFHRAFVLLCDPALQVQEESGAAGWDHYLAKCEASRRSSTSPSLDGK